MKLVLSWLLFAVVLLIYWTQLYHSHQTQWKEAEQQAILRADQTVQALSHQTERTLRKLRFIVEHLGEHWLSDDEASFRRVVAFAQQALPAGAIAQVAVADATGKLVFSNLDGKAGTLPSQASLSLADREYFRVHVADPTSGFHVGKAVKGRISQTWTLQLSSPLREQGRLAWVVVVSVDVNHLAEAFRQVFPDSADVVLLLNRDGSYLTRNHATEEVMGKKVPSDREFLQTPTKIQGHYRAIAPIDGVERYYSWVHVPGFPLILSLGLGRDKVLAPVRASVHHSHLQHLISVCLLIFAGWRITHLVLLRAEQTRLLAETTERLRQALDAVRDGLWEWEPASGRMQWDALCQLICMPDGQRLPTEFEPWLVCLHPEDRESVRQAFLAHAAAGQSDPVRVECRIAGTDSDVYRCIELRGRLLKQEAGASPLYVGTCSDISVRYQTQQMLETERLRMRVLLEQYHAGVLLEDAEQRIVLVNKPLCRLLDLELAPEQLVGWRHEDLLAALHPMRAAWLPEDRANDSRRNIEVNDEILQRNLSIDWVELRRGNEEGLGFLWLFHDITRRKQRERELAQLASTDSLTGLPNRRSFMTALEACLAESSAGSERGVVMMIDIDHFKRINDRHGHPVGDRVLQQVAGLLQDSLREGDLCARLGGEEFAILAKELTLDEGVRLAERVRALVAATAIRLSITENLSLTISIGVAGLATDNASKALMKADQALYQAKAVGRNQVCKA